MTSEQTVLIAEFWRKQLESSSWDNGDALQSAMAKMAREGVVIDAAKLDRFEERLAEEVAKLNDVRLSVDYHPCSLLADICKEVGIDSEFAFPCKTRMWMQDGEIMVSCGYRAPAERLAL